MYQNDIAKTIFDKLTARFRGQNILASDLKTLSEDISQNIAQRFKLVTQSEFEAQQKVLEKAQTKLAELETKLNTMQKEETSQ